MEGLCKKRFRCVFCGEDFDDDIRVGTDTAPVQDSDFRTHSQGVEAIPHGVHSCPSCGFTDERHEEKLQQQERSRILEHLGLHGSFCKGPLPFTAARKYELLAEIAILRNRASMEIAQDYLNAAWMAEDEANLELGQSCRQQAEDFLIKALKNQEVDSEKAPIITYLVGELNRRLGKFTEALEWFSRVRSEDPRLLAICNQQKFFASAKKSVNTRMPTGGSETRSKRF